VDVARRQSDVKGQPQQRVSKTAAHEHDLHADSPKSRDHIDCTGRNRIDVRARECIDFFATRTNRIQAKSVDLLERNPALHRSRREIGDASCDDIAAPGREPIDSLDSADCRIDVQNDTAKAGSGAGLGHASSPRTVWSAKRLNGCMGPGSLVCSALGGKTNVVQNRSVLQIFPCEPWSFRARQGDCRPIRATRAISCYAA